MPQGSVACGTSHATAHGRTRRAGRGGVTELVHPTSDDHLTAAGRRLFGWDEILEGGLAPGATVASWRGMTGAVTAARRGHDVVACPDDGVYLDYRQSDSPDEPIPVGIVLTVRDVYGFEPVPAELTKEEARHVLGGQANIWTAVSYTHLR